MPRVMQTLHVAYDGRVHCGIGIPTFPTAEKGEVQGLSRLILVDFAWMGKLHEGEQTYNGVKTRYDYFAPGDEHRLIIEAKNGTYTYVLTPAQFKAHDGGRMCFLGQIASPDDYVWPIPEDVPFRDPTER